MPEAHMTVHEFITHSKMHPELLPARMTEFDLERLRKVCSEKESQAEFGDWMKQSSTLLLQLLKEEEQAHVY